MATGRIGKWGNSLAVRIPKHIAEQAGVSEGDPVVIEAENGRVQLRRRRRRVPSLSELVAQITPENRYSEIDTGSARRKEDVEW